MQMRSSDLRVLMSGSLLSWLSISAKESQNECYRDAKALMRMCSDLRPSAVMVQSAGVS
jgi:hypothetical protein